MSTPGGSAQPVYLLIDMSGSMSRARFAECVNGAMPEIVDRLSHAGKGEAGHLLSIITFGDEVQVRLALDEPARMTHIPALAAAGLGYLAPGLAALGDAMEKDVAQAVADGVPRRNAARVIVITDGLPIDEAAALRAAFEELRRRTRELLGEVVVLALADEMASHLAALDVDVVVLDGELTASAVASTIVECAVRA